MTRQSRFHCLAPGVVMAVMAVPAAAAEPEADPSDMPRIPAVELADAPATFEVRGGFALKLVAGEPSVTDPIAVCFDADGRLYAVEMRDYPERREEALGRIRLLEDADGDGEFEKSVVFAGDLKWPTSVTCYEGGVFAVVTPDILYLKDTDGDGVADSREVVFTGLAEGTPVEKWNMEGLANGLQWGPDNRIWGTSSTSGGRLRRPGQAPAEAIDLGGRDFSFDPRTLELRAEHGGGQNGMSFDPYGRRYVCSNSRHLMAMLWERSWAGDSPILPLPAPLVGIAVDGEAAPVFRISPDEPWRIVRTRWRVAGVVGGPVEGGGRVSGYFTGATGVTIYTGDAYGPEYVGNAFIADVGSNLVHRKIVRHAEGGTAVALEGVRADDEAEREFLASRDNWFRPTNFANAPDGCLYVVDMYREVVEHPWSLPEGIKKHLDLYAGIDRGRIYRVEPEGFARRATPRLSNASSGDLVGLLGHANGWHRETAQRLLWERGDARAGAGWARAPEPDSPFARFRAALRSAVTARLDEAAGDPWMEAAILNHLTNGDEVLEAWRQSLGSGDAEAGEVVRPWKARLLLLRLIGKVADTGKVLALLATFHDPNGAAGRAFGSDRAMALRASGSLADGLVESGRWSAEIAAGFGRARIAPDGPRLGDAAREGAIGEPGVRGDAESRVAAIRLCGYLGNVEGFEALLDASQPEPVRLAAVRALQRAGAESGARALVDAWGSFDARLRAEALPAILGADGGALALLEAIGKRGIDVASLPPGSVDRLRGHPADRVRARAAELFPEEKPEPREAVLARYQPVLAMKGEAARGDVTYTQLCSGCHRAGGRGFAAGPDIESFKGAGREAILAGILDPNRQVAPPYFAYTVTLHGGEVLAGILARETTVNLAVRQAFGLERTVLRKDVAGMESSRRSLMPEGLEGALTQEDMANLLAFIESL